jgi:hypothetical protein
VRTRQSASIRFHRDHRALGRVTTPLHNSLAITLAEEKTLLNSLTRYTITERPLRMFSRPPFHPLATSRHQSRNSPPPSHSLIAHTSNQTKSLTASRHCVVRESYYRHVYRSTNPLPPLRAHAPPALDILPRPHPLGASLQHRSLLQKVQTALQTKQRFCRLLRMQSVRGRWLEPNGTVTYFFGFSRS